MTRQLDLFAPPAAEPHVEELDFAVERALALELPASIRLGTSSWTFPGWSGIVYPPGTSEAELIAHGLELYTRYPLFGTVGVDRSYYAPLDRETWSRYRAELPPGFPCVIKVFNEITNAVHPKTRDPNPRFLNLELFEREVLGPLADAFSDHVGALVFEFMPLRKHELPDPRRFQDRLADFFQRLPRGFNYAVELRNRELFTPGYLAALRANSVAHVLSFWERMPDVGEQLAAADVLSAPFVVSRLLIPPGQRYDARKGELQPFNRIVDVQQKMRDDVTNLALACEALGKVLLVIVNNKAEGSSPLTVRALAERISLARRARK